MLTILTILTLITTSILLGLLALIDLKTQILPNTLVLGFALCGYVFHFATLYTFVPPVDMALGGFIGGAGLFLLREIAFRLTGQDALGLGDVKLMAAAGLWLGPENLFLALAAGASFGVAHGLALHVQQRLSGNPSTITGLALPAGPGLILGIILVGAFEFASMAQERF